MRDWIEHCCEKKPDSDEYEAPCSFTIHDVYDEFLSKNKSICSLQTFYRMLSEEFKNVKFPQGNTIPKCAVCVGLKKEREKTRDRNELALISSRIKEHNNQQKLDFFYYFISKNKSMIF